MQSDIEIAQAAQPQRIDAIAEKAGIDDKYLEMYGKYKAKVDYNLLRENEHTPGKLVLVTAINPTPAGEGKTTTTVGLADALAKRGKNVMVALREPSLGPVFGIKGGAAGGGYAQVVPMEDINLHFTGDFHAIGAANNLLAAMLDAHIHNGNQLGIDVRKITWKRVVNMNDRQLRNIVDGLGGKANGVPREDGFDITVASEVMAIFCLATSITDLKERLGRIVVGYTFDDQPVTAHRSARRRRYGRAARRCAQAESRADARGHARVHPRRSLRQHRARMQLHHGDPDGRWRLATMPSPRLASVPTWARRSSSTSSAA